MFTDESFEIATFLNCTVEIIGDYLYNIEFLNSLPKNTSIYEFWSKTFNSIDSLDLERIINNDELFDYYCNMSNLFTKELNYSFSEEQLKKLIDTRHYQFLKFSNLQYSTEYIQSLIMKNPDDVDFVIDLPETVRNKMEIEAALLLNGRVDLINSDDIKKQNLYRIFADSMGLAFQIVIPGERLNIDRHLFDMIFTTKFQPSKIRFEYDTKRELYDSSNEEEKKNLDLSKFANNPHIYDKAEKMAGKSMTKKRFELLLKYINGVFDNRISDENIDDFLSKNPEVFIAFNQFVRQKDLPPHAIVECSISLYHSICNGTVDLFKDFCEFGVFPDMYYLTPELISTVGKDVIRRVAMFPETLYNLLLLQKENRLGLYKILIENSKDLTGDPIRNDCTLVFTCLAFPDLIQKMIDRNELNKENITKLMDLTKNWTVVDINKLNSIDEYYEVNNKFCDKVHETNQDLQTEKHLICRRYFNADYEYISEFYNMFIDSISNIKTDRYIDLFKKIEEIVNCENLDELKNMYRKYNKEFGSERMSLSELETKFKDEIIGVLGSKSFSNSSGPIDITGFDFDMVIHVFGGYGAAIKAKTPYDSWNSKTRIYNSGICTSLINGNYLGHAPTDNHSVIFGFNNIQNSDIRVLAPYD